MTKMKPAGLHAFLEISASIAHLRSKKARDFFREIYEKILLFQEHPFQELIFKGGTLLSAHNWSLVLPFFQAIHSLPADEDFIRRWTVFSYHLATQDIDAAIAFLAETPQAAKALGQERLSPWGRSGPGGVRLRQDHVEGRQGLSGGIGRGPVRHTAGTVAFFTAGSGAAGQGFPQRGRGLHPPGEPFLPAARREGNQANGLRKVFPPPSARRN